MHSGSRPLEPILIVEMKCRLVYRGGSGTTGGLCPSQVLVPLVLLQDLQAEGQSLDTLLPLGVRFLEETEADYIIQQGGWVSELGWGTGWQKGSVGL